VIFDKVDATMLGTRQAVFQTSVRDSSAASSYACKSSNAFQATAGVSGFGYGLSKTNFRCSHTIRVSDGIRGTAKRAARSEGIGTISRPILHHDGADAPLYRHAEELEDRHQMPVNCN
jgi:hypothetical protein